MGRNSVISREARQYIVQQVQENGIVTVADVANIVRRYYQFDPQKSFNHDVEQYSRRILANQKRQQWKSHFNCGKRRAGCLY